MKKLLLLLFILAPFLQYAQSEASMDKFIRIVGLAEKDIEFSGIKIDFVLNEIAANEYKQIRGKPITDIKNEFMGALKSIGVKTSDVEKDNFKNISKANYAKISTEHYILKVKTEEEALKIGQLSLDGVKVGAIEYIFDKSKEDFLTDMTVEAIKDAKRKAANIAKAVDKSVGEILNIEDLKNLRNSSSLRNKGKQKKQTLSYRVNVTFELN